MPEERGLYPRMRVRDQLVYLGRLCGRTSSEVGRSVDRWLERLGLADRANDRLDALSHGNQQRVQLIAALVNEPELLVLDEPFSGLDPLAIAAMSELLAELAAAGSDGAVLQPPARSGRGPLRGRRHHRPRPTSSPAGDLAELRAAVPQRFVDIRYRGTRTRLVGDCRRVEVVEADEGHARLRVDRDADLAAIVAAAGRGADLVSFAYQPPDALGAVPPGGGGMNGVRQGWLVAAREIRERSRSRAFLASVLLMVLVVAGRHRPARRARHRRHGTKDVGLTGATPAQLPAAMRAQGDAVGTTARIHHYDTLAAGEAAVRDGEVDVLVVDARQLEWRQRADEQLKAVVTGAIQLVAVRERADGRRDQPGRAARRGRAGTGQQRRARHGEGRSPDDETAAFIMTLVLFGAIAPTEPWS